jgi:hypothetical protein
MLLRYWLFNHHRALPASQMAGLDTEPILTICDHADPQEPGRMNSQFFTFSSKSQRQPESMEM